jgi:NAD(P)-dependent dehydrogenase (short-subunit alcohol dehydrogenase family)
MDQRSGERSLDDLVALVTGASSGIGQATVSAFARRGARVAAVDLDSSDGGDEALALVADVTDDRAVRRAVSATVDRLGRLDVIVNDAGIGAVGAVEDNDDAEWHRVFDVNVVGMVRVIRAALPHLRRSPAAAIVNVSSIAATAGLPQRVCYSASKGAVLALTLALAADLLGDGIRVNCVCPGTVDTPWVERLLRAAPDPADEHAALAARQPMGRLGTAEEVAEGIAWLASPASSFVTGTALAIDGGMGGLRVPIPPRS